MARPSRRMRILVAALAPAWGVLLPGSGRSDQVTLRDGRVLEGRFAVLPGVAVDPAKATQPSPITNVLVCDDELTRTMVAKRQVARTEEGPVDLGLERIRIPQQVPEKGRRVIGIGAALRATPFDVFGRRILTLDTAGGRVDVVQGITEITPRWTRLEGVQTEKPLLIDMRMATSAIPRDLLERVIARQVDPGDSDARLRVVRLLMQAERFDDAGRALDDVLGDFPDLAELAAERKTLARLAARQLLDEILARGRLGQDRLAGGLLDAFPVDDVDGELLE